MLKGTLDDFALPEILRFLATARKSGCIEVTRTQGDGRVFLREGDVYYGESSLSCGVDRLADEDGARRQIADTLFDLMRWDLGEFSFDPGVTVEPGVALRIPVEELIDETSQKLEELDVIATRIPNESAILAMAPTAPSDAPQINISPEEWRVLVLVNGQRSVADIADAVGRDSFSVMRTLYGLASTGLIEIVTAAAPAPEAAPAEVPEQTAPSDEQPQDETTMEEDPPTVSTDAAAEVDSEADPDPYVAALSAPLEGDALDAEMQAEFPPFEAPAAQPATNGYAAEALAPEQVDDAAPLAVADPADDDQGLHEDDELEQDFGSVADLEGAESEPEQETIPIEEAQVGAMVDRLAAVKELADLFDQTVDASTYHASGPPYPAELAAKATAEGSAEEAPEDGRRRVEDDEEITRGLISRLIDGVKGL